MAIDSSHRVIIGEMVFCVLSVVFDWILFIGNPNFADLFKCIINRFRKAGCILDIMRQTACLVFNLIMVEDYAALFSCMVVVQASDSMTDSM